MTAASHHAIGLRPAAAAERWAMDLDGVLAVGPPRAGRAWRAMSGAERAARREALAAHAAEARVLWRPDLERFDVVAARGEAARGATEEWLARAYGGAVGAVRLHEGSRTIARLTDAIARGLVELGTTDYVTASRPLVRALRRRLGARVRVWHFTAPGMTLR